MRKICGQRHENDYSRNELLFKYCHGAGSSSSRSTILNVANEIILSEPQGGKKKYLFSNSKEGISISWKSQEGSGMADIYICPSKDLNSNCTLSSFIGESSLCFLI